MNNIIAKNDKNYNSFVNETKLRYLNMSLKSSSKIESYIKKIKILNNKTGEIHQVKYDFMQIQKNNYLWYNFVSTYLQNKCIKDGLKAVFITLTNDSDLHRYKQLKSGKHIENPLFTNERDSYKSLNNAFRVLYNEFRINRKNIKTTFLRVVEPHKDFTPHLHGIIFLKEKEIPFLKEHLNNTIKRFKLGAQHDFTVLKDTEASVSYILKYVKKSINSDKEADSRVIDGWKKSNKIRMFTSSQIPISREVYKIVSRFVNLKNEDDSKYSILENLEDRISLNVEYFDCGTLYKSKKLFNDDSRYLVSLKKKRIINKDISSYLAISNNYNYYVHLDNFFEDLDSIDFDYESMHKYLYEYDHIGKLHYCSSDFDFKLYFRYFEFEDFKELYENYIHDCILDKKYSYKIIDFKIFDKEKEVYLYDKMDYELF